MSKKKVDKPKTWLLIRNLQFLSTHSLWVFLKMCFSWALYVAGISAWWDQSFGFLSKVNFEHLFFFYSHFIKYQYLPKSMSGIWNLSCLFTKWHDTHFFIVEAYLTTFVSKCIDFPVWYWAWRYVILGYITISLGCVKLSNLELNLNNNFWF